jgi:uncharacterized membrane protein YjgN (DUF898 family)
MAALERYKMQNTRFGDLPGDFVGSGGALFRRGIALWGLAAGIPIAGGALALALAGHGVAQGVVLGGTALVMMIALPIAFVLFRGTVMRWLVEGVRFGAVSLESSLRRDTVFGCYLKWIAATIGYGIVFGAVAGAAVAARAGGWRKLGENLAGNWTSHILDGVAIFVFYLVFLLGLGVLKRYFIDRGLWIAVAASTTVVNLRAADHVTAAGEPAGSLGEGLADALDVGAI